MELLSQPDIPGYPTGYLLSRIRGRSSRMVRDWAALVFDREATGPDHLDSAAAGRNDAAGRAAWLNLLREYGWIYRQMNQPLRKTFDLFFFYTELKTMIIGLRHIREKGEWNINELLDASLLSEDIKNALLLSPDQATAVQQIDKLLLPFAPGYRDMTLLLESAGIRSVEQKLVEVFLTTAVRTSRHSLLKRFFIRLIDCRNLMHLYQAVRFKRAAKLEFIAEGSVSGERMQTIAERDDAAAMTGLVREYTGITIERPDAAAVERALYHGMTRWLRKAEKDAGGIGLILDYLWRCSIEAMNRSVIAQGRFLEQEAVLAELVR